MSAYLPHVHKIFHCCELVVDKFPEQFVDIGIYCLPSMAPTTRSKTAKAPAKPATPAKAKVTKKVTKPTAKKTSKTAAEATKTKANNKKTAEAPKAIASDNQIVNVEPADVAPKVEKKDKRIKKTCRRYNGKPLLK